jgi:hypothetical protein
MRGGSTLAALLMVPVLALGGDLSGLTICIDPGHGGHNPANDRHVVPDPGIDFWESESNFQKALLLRQLLQEEGATVLLTRETNDYPNPPDAEPSLAARVAFANANNVDWFHSIHSNATGIVPNTSINYTLMLVREQIVAGGDPVYGPGTGSPEWPDAWTISTQYMAPGIFSQLRTQRHTSSLDWTFYGGANGGFTLGVLRGLLMPGELSEGSMHDFYPETRRLMNNDYRKMEAYALRNAWMKFFATDPDTTGIIAGIQTDIATAKPVNYSRVRLLPVDRLYAGDAYNNGFYMFDRLEPGSYTVRFETPGYTLDSATVTVNPWGTTFRDRALVSFAAPTVITTTPSEGDTAYLANLPVRIFFSKPMDPASVEQAFVLDPAAAGSITWASGNSSMTFTPDAVLPFFVDFTVTIDTTARSATGQTIDGNGDGIPGDPFVLHFRTAFVDGVPPSIVSANPAVDETLASPTNILNLTFDEPLNPATVTVSNIALAEVGGAQQPKTLEYALAHQQGGVSVILPNGLKSGSSYLFRVSGIADTVANVIATQVWQFSVRPGALATTWLDSLAGPLSRWRDPFAGGLTTGVDSVRFLGPGTEAFPPGAGASRAADLEIAWDTLSSAWLLDLERDSAAASEVTWSGDAVLRLYMFGDGSRSDVRFVVNDSLTSAPAGTPTAAEVSRWIPIDWVGWRMVCWDLANDSLGTWVGDGNLDERLRMRGLQLRYRPGTSLPHASLSLAWLQLAERIPSDVREPGVEVPRQFALSQNYPNPFNPSTTIAFDLPRAAQVRLSLFDALGREVRLLLEGAYPAGRQTVRWDGRDQSGREVASGIYLLRMAVRGPDGAREFTATRKVLLMK